MRRLRFLATAIMLSTLAIFPASLSVAYTPALERPVVLPQVDVTDISKHIARVGAGGAVLFAIEKLFDGIDYVMDPANNQVILNLPDGNYCSTESKDCVNTLEEAGSKFIAFYNNHHREEILKEGDVKCQFNFLQYETGIDCFWKFPDEAIRNRHFPYGGKVRPDTLSFDQIAQEILNNALQGHLESIQFIQEAAKAAAAAAAEKQTPPASSPASPSTNPESPTTTPAQPVIPPNTDDSTTAPPQPIINNPTQPIIGKMTAQCEAEWKEAYKICADLIDKGINNGITGGYTNDFQCAKGLVSQECGGNKVR